jgi:hypothetical protein
MKKLSMLFVAVMSIIVLCGVAIAAPFTWTDTITFQNVLIPPTKNYYHNIADNGFQSAWMAPGIGNDTITSYSLEIALCDDKSGNNEGRMFRKSWVADSEGANILTAGGFYHYDFSLASEKYPGGPLGKLDIFHDGTLNVSIWSSEGDFYLVSSKLTVNGDNGNPVPEPATMLLLGLGLVGLAGFGRKRFNS